MATFIENALKLAQEIDNKYKEASYKIDCFADIAFKCMTEATITYDLKSQDIVKHQLENLTALTYNRENFSDFPIIIFENKHFVIQALHWYNASSSIHEHGFSGAFKVLKGSSIETLYKFSHASRLDDSAEVGKLQRTKINHLKEGSVRKIKGGNAYIHSLFHIESPSITLIARTHMSYRFIPQKSYYAPSLASNYFEKIYETQKLTAILLADNGRLVTLATEEMNYLTSKLNANQLIELLLNYGDIQDVKLTDSLKRVYGHKNTDLILQTIKLERIKRQLMMWRSALSDAKSRLVLASIINSTTRQDIYQLLELISPEESPIRLVSKTIVNLLEKKLINFTIKVDSIHQIVKASISSSHKEEYLNKVSNIFACELGTEQRELLSKFWDKLTSEPTLAPLWQ